MNPITCVYRVREEAGKNLIGSIKFKLSGKVLAVSGIGSRVIVEIPENPEINDIGKDASKLVCHFDAADFGYLCALNEDGSEAAFVNSTELRIVDVGKVAGVKADQPAIVTINDPASTGWTNQLVYDDGGKLHLLHDGDKVLAKLGNPTPIFRF